MNRESLQREIKEMYMKGYQRKNATIVFLISMLVGSVAYAEQIELFGGGGRN